MPAVRPGLEPAQVLVPVGDRAGGPRLVPSLWRLDKPVSPASQPLLGGQVQLLEAGHVDAVGDREQPLRRECEHLCRLLAEVRRDRDHAVRPRRRGAQAPRPVLAVHPALPARLGDQVPLVPAQVLRRPPNRPAGRRPSRPGRSRASARSRTGGRSARASGSRSRAGGSPAACPGTAPWPRRGWVSGGGGAGPRAPSPKRRPRMPSRPARCGLRPRGTREANTLSGAPGRSSKEGCIGMGSASAGRDPASWARTASSYATEVEALVLEEALRMPAVARRARGTRPRARPANPLAPAPAPGTGPPATTRRADRR